MDVNYKEKKNFMQRNNKSLLYRYRRRRFHMLDDDIYADGKIGSLVIYHAAIPNKYISRLEMRISLWKVNIQNMNYSQMKKSAWRYQYRISYRISFPWRSPELPLISITAFSYQRSFIIYEAIRLQFATSAMCRRRAWETITADSEDIYDKASRELPLIQASCTRF